MSLLPWKRAVRESGPQTSSFEDLVLPLLPSLYNVASWLARNPTDAEDLVQEIFLKALRGFTSFEPGTNFRAWVFRILRNTYLTSRTGLAATRTVALEEELDEQGEFGAAMYPEAAIDRQTPEINLMRLGDRAALHAAMEKLPAVPARGASSVRRRGDEVQGDCHRSRYPDWDCDVPDRARTRDPSRNVAGSQETQGVPLVTEHLSLAILNALADGELSADQLAQRNGASRWLPVMYFQRSLSEPAQIGHRKGRTPVLSAAASAGAAYATEDFANDGIELSLRTPHRLRG